MALTPIYWTEFTWEAFATLATGAAAVIAAVVVGLRQAGIADRQTTILAKQVELEDTRLKSELFDKRFEVYEDIERMIIEVVRQGAKPDWQHQQKYIAAMHRSKFLFRPEVFEELEEVWKRCCDGFANYSEKIASFDRTGDYGQAHIEKDYEFMLWISETLGRLPDIFGDELRLGQKPSA